MVEYKQLEILKIPKGIFLDELAFSLTGRRRLHSSPLITRVIRLWNLDIKWIKLSSPVFKLNVMLLLMFTLIIL